MTSKVKKEVEELIKEFELNCSIEEFKQKADWIDISMSRDISEDFIREFREVVNWHYISSDQVLSEDFIREFKDEVNWVRISCYQTLSEDFIKEFKDRVCWASLFGYGYCGDLSENFIYNMKEVMGEKNFNYCLERGKITQEYINSRKVVVTRFELLDFED